MLCCPSNKKISCNKSYRLKTALRIISNHAYWVAAWCLKSKSNRPQEPNFRKLSYMVGVDHPPLQIARELWVHNENAHIEVSCSSIALSGLSELRHESTKMNVKKQRHQSAVTHWVHDNSVQTVNAFLSCFFHSLSSLPFPRIHDPNSPLLLSGLRPLWTLHLFNFIELFLKHGMRNLVIPPQALASSRTTKPWDELLTTPNLMFELMCVTNTSLKKSEQASVGA